MRAGGEIDENFYVYGTDFLIQRERVCVYVCVWGGGEGGLTLSLMLRHEVRRGRGTEAEYSKLTHPG